MFNKKVFVVAAFIVAGLFSVTAMAATSAASAEEHFKAAVKAGDVDLAQKWANVMLVEHKAAETEQRAKLLKAAADNANRLERLIELAPEFMSMWEMAMGDDMAIDTTGKRLTNSDAQFIKVARGVLMYISGDPKGKDEVAKGLEDFHKAEKANEKYFENRRNGVLR